MKRILDMLTFARDLWRAVRTPLPPRAEPAAPEPASTRRLEGHLFIANCQYEPVECPWSERYVSIDFGMPSACLICSACHRRVDVEMQA